MNRITELRKNQRLSQGDLAAFVGCSQKSMSNYEKGSREVPYNILKKLSVAFNCSPEYILGESDIKSPAAQGSEAVIGSNYSTELNDNAMRLQQRALSKLLGLNEQSLRQAISFLEVLEERQARQGTAPEAQD